MYKSKKCGNTLNKSILPHFKIIWKLIMQFQWLLHQYRRPILKE